MSLGVAVSFGSRVTVPLGEVDLSGADNGDANGEEDELWMMEPKEERVLEKKRRPY